MEVIDRVLPWEKLGTATPFKRASDVIEAAGLNWGVSLEELYIKDPSQPEVWRPDIIKVEDRMAIVRDTDHFTLGVASPTYHPIPNRELFEFADFMVDTGEANYISAGGFNRGRVVYIQMAMPEHLLVNGEAIDGTILFTTSHDGSLAFKAMVTPVVVRCLNTLAMAMDKAVASWTVRHTTSATGKVQEAREALRLSWAYLGEFGKEVERLMEMKVKDGDVEKFLSLIFPAREDESQTKHTQIGNKREAVWGIYNSPTVTPIRDSGWGFLNAVNEWELWYSGVRGGENARAESMAKKILARRMPLTTKARELVTIE